MSTFDIHPASDDEKRQAYRNVHEVWGGDLKLDAYVERRLNSRQHNRAQWWVLTVNGEVASSLGRYPLTFCFDGNTVPGFGIGAVHTPTAHRRHGYADALCREVLRASTAEGDQFGLLFSDIKPSYYANMGFIQCNYAQRWRCDGLPELAQGESASIAPLSEPSKHLELLERAYQNHHNGELLYLHRSAEYWDFNLSNSPGDRFFSIDGNKGYARVAEDNGGLFLVELALIKPDDDHHTRVFRAFAQHALERELGFLTGWWLVPPSTIRNAFTPTPLGRAIPMVAPMQHDARVALWLENHARIWSADHF